MPDRIATTKEVAQALGLSTASIQAYARAEKIPFDVTPGGHRRFDVAEVQMHLAARISTNVEEKREDTATLRLTPIALGLGRGVAAPTSEIALANRAARSVRPEPRPEVSDRPARVPSALSKFVSHARGWTLSAVGTH